MKLAIEISSKLWNYVEAILRDWGDKGYQTLDDVHVACFAYKHQIKHPPGKKPIRQEYLPDWLHNQNQDTQPKHNPSFEEKKRLFQKRLKRSKEDINLGH